MANPSLKAQIEAAKSALASDLVVPSLVVPPPKPPMTPTTPFMEDNNIPGVPQQIKKEQAEDPALLTEENIGTVFIDTDSKNVFIIVADSNGNPVKQELYSG